ncbi:MAG TPA: 5'-nucleotidase, partial [Gammaproteobacteria bacterium]|nr:5'-nucleotidase [Gammaproteobacteria bacterium]
LSADMHEETANAVVIVNPVSGRKTIVVEEGQDGTMMGRLKLELAYGKVKKWEWKPIRVDSSIAENKNVAARIKQIRNGFTGSSYADKINPFNGSYLKRPIDTVVGSTAVPLHRSNFTDENMPAIIEGSSHAFLTDAFKAMTGADIAAIRGFRYGTHVPVGPIKYEDLFHYLPIGPQIATGTLKGQAIKNQIENAANGSLNPNIIDWSGGWLFNFSGLTMDFDPYVPLTTNAPYPLDVGRAFNIKANNADLVLGNNYSYASYYYSNTPCSINTIAIPGCVVDPVTGAPSNITVLKDVDGSPLDATEVVVNYLQSLNSPVNPVLNRITLKDKTTGLPTSLPAAKFGNQELQPLQGAQR